MLLEVSVEVPQTARLILSLLLAILLCDRSPKDPMSYCRDTNSSMCIAALWTGSS